jgi:kynurenine formamidase
MMPQSWNQKLHNYGDAHERQVIDIRQRREPFANSNIWIVFIHGGGWQAPQQTWKDIDPTFNFFINETEKFTRARRIKGFASIDYGLSRFLDSTPGHNYKHPQHVQDVIKALVWLSRYDKFDAVDNKKEYILIGHSAGATMAFQILMGLVDLPASLQMPVAVIGTSGIYDIPLFVSDPQHPERYEPYRDMIVRAFGDDEASWKSASPALSGGRPSWKIEERIVVLSHSVEDELVELEQSEKMWDVVTRSGVRNGRLLKTTGQHDEGWKNGRDIVNAIEVAVMELE